jgi:hypothetical protein
MVSKIKLRLAISAGEKSRVPLGTDGLMDAMRQMYKNILPTKCAYGTYEKQVAYFYQPDMPMAHENCITGPGGTFGGLQSAKITRGVP